MTSDDFTGLAGLRYLEQGLTLNRGLELKARHFLTIYTLTLHDPFQFFSWTTKAPWGETKELAIPCLDQMTKHSLDLKEQ